MTQYAHSSDEIPQKQCTGTCGQLLPATLEFFHPQERGKYGLRGDCRECRKASRRKPPKAPITKRTCKMCGIEKSIIEFQNSTTKTANGITTEQVCHDCRNAKQRTYREQNLELVKSQERHNSHKHRDKRNQRARERRRQNPLPFRLKNKRWRDRNPEKVRLIQSSQSAKQATQKWRRNHPDAVRVQKINRRAREIQAEGFHTAADIQKQRERQHSKCYWCKCKLTTYHVDHIIPLSRNGTNWPDNIVLACPTCNMKRNNKLPHEWSEGGRLL